jgi:hypothetical protein
MFIYFCDFVTKSFIGRNRKTTMRQQVITFFVLSIASLLFFHPAALSQEEEKEAEDAAPSTLSLFQAVMCEEISANLPRNQTVVFSVAREKAICFTSFDAVPEKVFVYHNWYFRDLPSARIRLTLNPPRWSVYSSIQIRKTDIGPWRVEITDDEGHIFRVLRFSITE